MHRDPSWHHRGVERPREGGRKKELRESSRVEDTRMRAHAQDVFQLVFPLGVASTVADAVAQAQTASETAQ
jgi:hypothetical protein